ncbi:Protein arginine methyltransferase NDUFAF7 [Balamuthia mandrillaris]
MMLTSLRPVAAGGKATPTWGLLLLPHTRAVASNVSPIRLQCRWRSNNSKEDEEAHKQRSKSDRRPLPFELPTDMRDYGSYEPVITWPFSSSSSSAAAETATEPKERQVLIDRTPLARPAATKPSTTPKSPRTPLVEYLASLLQLRGPIPVSTYMKEALTNPLHGYYMNKDVFGASGDFITSPEITQMFGELIGGWCCDVWAKMGEPKEVQLIELGPGRGSLMHDALRTIKKARPFFDALTVNFVEVSPFMREKQATALGCDVNALKAFHQTQQPSKPAAISESVVVPPSVKSTATTGNTDMDISSSTPVMQGHNGIKVRWHRHLSDIPQGPTILLAHEFFDALPVHQFQFTEKGWRERMVDLNYGDGPHHLQYVLSPSETLATKVMLKHFETDKTKPSIGASVEVCLEGMAYSQQIATRLKQNKGAALIIDYGENFTQGDTVRAIKDHKFTDIFCEPGRCDITADVDFSALKQSAASITNINAFGPVTQSSFLQDLGIDARTAMLLKTVKPSETEDLIAAYERLVDSSSSGMGQSYKALALCSVGIHPLGFQ